MYTNDSRSNSEISWSERAAQPMIPFERFDQIDSIFSNLDGDMLSERYKIEQYFEQECGDNVFQASYIREQTNEALVIKVREYTPEVERKLKPLMDLREACGTQRDQVGSLGNPPMLKSCGLFNLSDQSDVPNCPEL